MVARGVIVQPLRGPAARLVWWFQAPELDAMILAYEPGKYLHEGLKIILVKTAPHHMQTSTLVTCNLPTEIIQEIYSHFDLSIDVVCLGATCQVLWEVGRRSIYRQITVSAAPYCWTGDRIICVGDCLDNEDIPGHILTPAEKEKYLVKTEGDEDSDLEGNSEGTLWGYPFDHISGMGFSLSEFWAKIGVYERIPCFRTLWLLKELCGISSSQLASGSATRKVLRNLSRQQYVREEALQLHHLKDPHDEGLLHVGFDDAVLLRICLTSSDLQSLLPHRNWDLWAGDRFDVVEDSEALHEDVSWSDVSDKVLEELQAVRKWFHIC